jgi:hypothetical protein
VPLVIKNTNNPKHPGTRIVAKRSVTGSPVVGIAADGDFTSLNISKYLMNREIGFGRKVLHILENLGIRFEHMPTGIDDMSIIHAQPLPEPSKSSFSVIQNLTESLQPDVLNFEKNPLDHHDRRRRYERTHRGPQPARPTPSPKLALISRCSRKGHQKFQLCLSSNQTKKKPRSKHFMKPFSKIR